MENLPNNVSSLRKTSEYRFKAETVKKILEDFKTEFKKSKLDKAIDIDKKKHPVYIDFNKITKIIEKHIQVDKFNVKFTPENIVDGYGNIVIVYNGNPYITLDLVLMALKTHNNIVFISKKYYAVNSIIIQTLNNVCKNLKYVDKMSIVEFSDIDKLVQSQSLFDMMVYIGDKREYLKIKRKISLPTIFYGYNYVDVYVESRDFKELLLDIDKYANQYNVEVNYFDNTSHEETFSFINKYEISDCFVLLSKNTDTIYKFMSHLKVNKFYINQNPFENYDFEFNERDLTYNKKIFLKKI